MKDRNRGSRIDETVEARVPVSTAFAFMADFTTTEQWDAGTVRTVRVSGDGGVGTTYHNTSRFLGRETELVYVVTEYEPDVRIVLRGEGKSVVAYDTITVSAVPAGGVSVRYEAEFHLQGWSRFIQPLLAPAFARLGRQGARGMRKALGELGSIG